MPVAAAVAGADALSPPEQPVAIIVIISKSVEVGGRYREAVRNMITPPDQLKGEIMFDRCR